VSGSQKFEQHSVLSVHALPSGTHVSAPQTPLELQLPLQQSPSAVHAPPSSVQSLVWQE
jgi:hypothetical protein